MRSGQKNAPSRNARPAGLGTAVLAAAVLLGLAGCGFGLRGLGKGPEAFPALQGAWSVRPDAGLTGPHLEREFRSWKVLAAPGDSGTRDATSPENGPGIGPDAENGSRNPNRDRLSRADAEVSADVDADAKLNADVQDPGPETVSHVRILEARRAGFAAPWSGSDPVRHHELRLSVKYRVERGDRATPAYVVRARTARRIPDETVSDRVDGLAPIWDDLYREVVRKMIPRLRTLRDEDFSRSMEEAARTDPRPFGEPDLDLSLPENAVDR